jgi:hypothetical protein
MDEEPEAWKQVIGGFILMAFLIWFIAIALTY